MTRVARGVLVVLMLGAGYGVAAAEPFVDLEGRYWFTEVDGSAKVKSGSQPATEVDLKNDLGIDNENIPEVRLTIFTGLNGRLRIAYNPIRIDSTTTLSRTIRFGGTTFAANARVDTELDIDYVRLGWIWQPLAVPGVLKFGPVFEVKGFLIDASLKTRGLTPEVKESETFPFVLPTLGLALDVTPHSTIDLFAEASGVPAGNYGHMVDAEAGVRFVPFRFFTLSAGYRIVDIRVEPNRDFAKLRFFGPFVGASVRF